MKLLIVTTSKETLDWKSLSNKLKAIKDGLNRTRNADWEVEILYKELTPEIKDGRITHAWFDGISIPLFQQGNHFICLHMSDKQRKAWKIKPSLRGSNQRDSDLRGEMYVWADENTQRGTTRTNQFIQSILHECSHEIANATEVPDKTHEYHDKNTNIAGIFDSYDLKTWKPKYEAYQKAEISSLQALIAKLTPVSKPLFPYRISQAYGVRNDAWYPRTKHHIGTDFAVPEGTPILAPWDCEVTQSLFSTQLGNYCEVKYGGKYYYFMHLKSKAYPGIKKKGWVMCISGNTGFSTAPHLHIECWTIPRDITKLNESNYKQFTSPIK